MTIEEERTRLAVRKVELVTAAKEARKHAHVHAMLAMLGLSPSPTLHACMRHAHHVRMPAPAHTG